MTTPPLAGLFQVRPKPNNILGELLLDLLQKAYNGVMSATSKDAEVSVILPLRLSRTSSRLCEKLNYAR
jgi:hypothetical protein